MPGASLRHLHELRTLAGSEAIIAHAGTARSCLVVGASFIGPEVAASSRTRGLEVQVVACEARPMERVMGAAIGDMLSAIHESYGVSFHLGATIAGSQHGARAKLQARNMLGQQRRFSVAPLFWSSAYSTRAMRSRRFSKKSNMRRLCCAMCVGYRR